MREIKLRSKDSIFRFYFRIRSRMLFPDVPEFQKAAFLMDFYSFVVRHRKSKQKFDLSHETYKKAASGLKTAFKIASREVPPPDGYWQKNREAPLSFYNQYTSRRKSLVTAGIMTRLVYSLSHHGIHEAGKRKAFELYTFKMDEKKRKGLIKVNTSVGSARDSLVIHRDALHFCAAQNLVKPLSAKSEEEFGKRFENFLSYAETIKDFCLQHTGARRNKNELLVEPDTLLTTPSELGVIPANMKLGVYSLKEISRVAKTAGIILMKDGVPIELVDESAGS